MGQIFMNCVLFLRMEAAALPAAARRNQCAPVTPGLNEIRFNQWSMVVGRPTLQSNPITYFYTILYY